MNSFSLPRIVCRQHVYQRVWTPFFRGKATTAKEANSKHNCHTTGSAMLKDESLHTVGQIGSCSPTPDFPTSTGPFFPCLKNRKWSIHSRITELMFHPHFALIMTYSYPWQSVGTLRKLYMQSCYMDLCTF